MIDVAVLVALAVASMALVAVMTWVARLLLRRPGRLLARSLVENLRIPLAILVPLIVLEAVTGALSFDPTVTSNLLHGFGIAIDLTTGFLIIRATYVLDDVLLARYRIDQADNLRARQVQTQIVVFRRITVVAVSVVSLAVALLTFREVRAAGTGLLASAGVVGLVVGIAARPVASNILAGLQIALSQPIRVDDVVVVEGQWGRIEQIALTYVVVQLWDLRRLVLPISYFIEQPFENWTRRSSEVLGSVYLEVDYTAPIDDIRKRFEEILAESDKWNGRVGVLQVTGSGPATVQLRALVSANDSGSSWDLQCEVRERLITWLQREHPHALPRQRQEVTSGGGAGELGE
jgi:small-conductance mechanosensitive channel